MHAQEVSADYCARRANRLRGSRHVAHRDPVCGRRLVDGQHGKGFACVGAQVARDHILGLDTVLDEVGVPAGLKCDVVQHA